MKKSLAGVVTLLLLTLDLVSAASLEITASPQIFLPTLVFVEAENPALNIPLHHDAAQAQLVSYRLSFEPAIQVLPVGTEIKVSNADPILHNAHVFDHHRTLFNVATPMTGTSVQRKLTRPGLFNVRCDLHPAMSAWIAVVSNPNYAMIEKSGVYNIDNLASGRYTLHVLQAGGQEQILPLELVSGQQKKIQLTPH